MVQVRLRVRVRVKVRVKVRVRVRVRLRVERSLEGNGLGRQRSLVPPPNYSEPWPVDPVTRENP